MTGFTIFSLIKKYLPQNLAKLFTDSQINNKKTYVTQISFRTQIGIIISNHGPI